MGNRFLHILFLFSSLSLYAQTEPLTITKDSVLVVKDSVVTKTEYDPLSPSRAAFYSAVLPGLGQAYNKKYWKIPIIYAGIGTGIYFYVQNTDDYNRFRDAYKRRLAGFTDDEFQGISDQRLRDAQKTAGRNRNVSILVSIAFYILNIVDANVDAHLQQYNLSEDLTLLPKIDANNMNARTHYGLSLTYTLK